MSWELFIGERYFTSVIEIIHWFDAGVHALWPLLPD